MIINFSVQNFHSVKDKVTLSFEADNSDDLQDYYIIEPKEGLRLLKLGLIYGANASGKTTILKALDFLRRMVLDPLERKTEPLDYKPFLFDDKTPRESSFFTLEFVKNKVKYLYEVEFNKKAVVHEKLDFYDPKKALVYERRTDLGKQLSKITFGGKIKINTKHKATLEANTLWNNTVLGGYLKTNVGAYELREVMDWFGAVLKPLIAPRQSLFTYISDKLENKEVNTNSIIEFLKKADFKISDIIIEKEVEEFDTDIIKLAFKKIPDTDERINKIKETGKIEVNKIFFQHVTKKNKAYVLPYEDESSGTQRYYQFSGLLSLMMGYESVFSIDELESSLHPELLKHFLLSFLVNTKRSQLIATTHHRELLMEKNIFRNDVIWFTEKKDDGSTDLFSLADFDSSVIRNTSSVYNAYKIGKLGATPNLSDYYIDLEDGKE